MPGLGGTVRGSLRSNRPTRSSSRGLYVGGRSPGTGVGRRPQPAVTMPRVPYTGGSAASAASSAVTARPPQRRVTAGKDPRLSEFLGRYKKRVGEARAEGAPKMDIERRRQMAEGSIADYAAAQKEQLKESLAASGVGGASAGTIGGERARAIDEGARTRAAKVGAQMETDAALADLSAEERHRGRIDALESNITPWAAQGQFGLAATGQALSHDLGQQQVDLSRDALAQQVERDKRMAVMQMLGLF